MAQYKYKAINKTGEIITGRVQAANMLELEHRLSTLGQELITCNELKASMTRFSRRQITQPRISIRTINKIRCTFIR